MHVFLIRHCEAAKNIDTTFSGSDGSDGLTDKGRREAADLANAIAVVERRFELRFARVVSARSPRARQTAFALATALEREILVQEGLESIGSGVLAGRSETEAWQRHP